MDWLAENWVWVLFGIGMVAMHLFGHGGHGGHGGRDATKPPGKDSKQSAQNQRANHSH